MIKAFKRQSFAWIGFILSTCVSIFLAAIHGFIPWLGIFFMACFVAIILMEKDNA